MAMDCKVPFGVYAMFGLAFAILVPSVQAQPLVPAPIDGTTIDQVIACGLMLLALVLTYLIHTVDAPLNI